MNVAEERQDLRWDLRKFAVRHSVHYFELPRRDALKPRNTSPQVHDLAQDGVAAPFHTEYAFFQFTDRSVKIINDRHIEIDDAVEYLVQKISRATAACE